MLSDDFFKFAFLCKKAHCLTPLGYILEGHRQNGFMIINLH